MTQPTDSPVSPTKAWDRVAWLPPSPGAEQDAKDKNTPPRAGHAHATCFQRDLYNVRTKDGDVPVPEGYHHAIEVLDVSRLITRPDSYSLAHRVELPPRTRHVRMKSTQIEIPRYVRADADIRSITYFLHLTAGTTAVCAAPCDTDNLVLNIQYPPQRPCHLDAANDFTIGHLTVILTPASPSTSGPHRILMDDIRTLVCAAALHHDEDELDKAKPVATLVGDNIPQMDWHVDRRSPAVVQRFLAECGGQIPAGLVEVLDLEAYRARVGEDAFKLHTQW